MKVKYSIQYKDLEIDYQDSGIWRSYELSASGNTLEEMLEDATISEIDQDGETLDCYGIEEVRLGVFGNFIATGSEKINEVATKLIKEEVK